MTRVGGGLHTTVRDADDTGDDHSKSRGAFGDQPIALAIASGARVLIDFTVTYKRRLDPQRLGDVHLAQCVALVDARHDEFNANAVSHLAPWLLALRLLGRVAA